MLRRRRRLVPVLAGLAAMVAVSATVVAVTRARRGDGRAARIAAARLPPSPPAGSPAAPSSQPVAVGSDLLVDVTVATLWSEPQMARPVDGPSLTNPVDVTRWVATMTVADKRWLVGRLVTQALYGERVTVVETRGDWARVTIADQPTSLDPRGYPGWLPAVQLSRRPAGPDADGGRSAVVTAPLSRLRDGGTLQNPGLEVTYATRLPVEAVDDQWATVATPDGGHGRLARSDVEIVDSRPGPATGAELVRSAQLFSGVPYLWAGTSALGFDCSGLVWAVYRAHGLVVPRDADDQAVAGVSVGPSDLEPGDLLFYASGPGPASVHHVAMYVGAGMMIQSPATGKTVETVPVGAPAFARQFRVARRYPSP
jgi:cell wall-associated NlpC family hydrolase